MATIYGSQFQAFAGPVNPVFTTDGTTDTNGNPLSGDTVAGDFNLEVFVGAVASAPPIASLYDGLAVLLPSGIEINLISGTYQVADSGSGGNTISAYGANEEIDGISGDTLNLNGNFEKVIGKSNTINVNGNFENADGRDGTINVNGALNTIFSEGGNTINVNSQFNTIDNTFDDILNISGDANQVAVGADDTISVVGNFNIVQVQSLVLLPIPLTVHGDYNVIGAPAGISGTGIIVGSHDSIAAGLGGDLTVTGDYDSISGAVGSFTVTGDFETIIGGQTIVASGTHEVISGGGPGVSITANGDFDTIQVRVAADAVVANGSHDLIGTTQGFAGPNSLTANGDFDTIYSIPADPGFAALPGFVTSATGADDAIYLGGTYDITGGSNDTLYADPNAFPDLSSTVTGFAQASGDRIHLPIGDGVAFALGHTQLANGGADTLITLSSGSTILLKGITHIDMSFFI